MCDPISIGIAVLGAATAAGAHQAGQYAYDAQRDAYSRNKDLANANALTQYAALQRREMEEQMAANQAIQENARRAAMASGSSVAIAGAAGAAGGSVGAALSEIRRQELGFTAVTDRNVGFRTAQFAMEREGIRTGLASHMLAALPTIAPPSFAGTALRIGGASLEGYGAHLQYGKTPASTQQPDPYGGPIF